MKNLNIQHWVVLSQKFGKDNAPLLLTGTAMAGTIFGSYKLVTASLKAAKVLADAEFVVKQNTGFAANPPISVPEKIKLTWKLYVLPSAIIGVSVGCMGLAHKVNAKRLAGLAVAYSLTENRFKEYEDKIKEKLGVGKEQQARDELAQERYAKDEAQASIIVVGEAELICYDQFTGRYFKSDMESLRRAENDVNARVNSSMYATLSDFYECVGLPATSYSDEVGFNHSNRCELRFSSVLTQDGKPALAFDFKAFPVRNFDYQDDARN